MELDNDDSYRSSDPLPLLYNVKVYEPRVDNINEVDDRECCLDTLNNSVNDIKDENQTHLVLEVLDGDLLAPLLQLVVGPGDDLTLHDRSACV